MSHLLIGCSLQSYQTYVASTIHVRMAAQGGTQSEASRLLAVCLENLQENSATNPGVRKMHGIICTLMEKLKVHLPNTVNEALPLMTQGMHCSRVLWTSFNKDKDLFFPDNVDLGAIIRLVYLEVEFLTFSAHSGWNLRSRYHYHFPKWTISILWVLICKTLCMASLGWSKELCEFGWGIESSSETRLAWKRIFHNAVLTFRHTVKSGRTRPILHARIALEQSDNVLCKLTFCDCMLRPTCQRQYPHRYLIPRWRR